MLNPFKMIKNVKARLAKFKAETDATMQNFAEFMDAGVWRANATMTVFYKKGYKKQCEKETAYTTLYAVRNNLVDRSTKIARKIFKWTYKFKVTGENKTFHGKVFLLSTSGRVNRFIDYDAKQILLKYKYADLMNRDVARKRAWGEFFTVAPFRKTDFDNLFSVEDYVERKDCPVDKEFSLILQDYIAFSKKQTPAVTEKTALSEKAKSAIIKRFTDRGQPADGENVVKYLETNGYVTTLSHGDMSPFNALFDGEKIYYIDFEMLDKRSFFYDLMEYLSWCDVYKKTPLSSDYFNGKYDKEFTELFANYGLKFDENLRRTYFNIFVAENRINLRNLKD